MMAGLLAGTLLLWTQAVTALPEATVDVNTAGVEQLAEMLDGVGLNRAKAIVEYRQKFGPFVDLADLQEVSGIGPSLIATNKDRIVFGK
jgi:competence protein ComEA